MFLTSKTFQQKPKPINPADWQKSPYDKQLKQKSSPMPHTFKESLIFTEDA